MNRIMRGTIAGAAGVALLLGGAGTFALWNTSVGTAAASVQSGTMTMTANSDGTWTDITNGRSTVIDPTTFRIVPGNKLQFKQTLSIAATGQDLKADLTYNSQSITGDAALKAAVVTTLGVTSANANVVQSATANTFTVTPSTSASTVTVTFTIELPSTATTGQNGTLNLSGLTFTLTQKAIS